LTDSADSSNAAFEGFARGVRRVAVVFASVAVLASVGPPSAAAHLRSGTVAVDYRASVLHPHTFAYSAQIFQSDRALSLTGNPGHVIVLVGYLGEPVFRLDAAGLWTNVASPTAVVVRLIPKSSRILATTPRWRLARGRRSVIWQDGRTQTLPPGIHRGEWKVPLIVDGRRSDLQGEIERFPAPELWPWLGMLAVLVGAAVAVLVLRRRDLYASAATGFALAASVASVLILVGFALDAYASPGTWIEGFDSIAFLAVGIWVLFRGPHRWRVAGAIGAGLVALAVGLLEGAVFLHPIVLAVLPAGVVRLACIVAIGAGLSAAAIGAVFYVETEGRRARMQNEAMVPAIGPEPPWRSRPGSPRG
jgi:hypothetical protein